MAEINIQRKKRSVWPWVLALLIVLALAAFLYFAFNDDTTVTETTGFQLTFPVLQASAANFSSSFLTC